LELTGLIAALFTDCVEILVPYIDANFRTLTDRRHRAVAERLFPDSLHTHIGDLKQ
jgi:hypothetical protein